MILKDPSNAILGLLDKCPDIHCLEFSFLEKKNKTINDTTALLTPEQRDVVLNIKHEYGISFWQSALGIFPHHLLQQENFNSYILRHNGPGSETKIISKVEYLQHGLDGLPFDSEKGSINILSRVYMNDGATRYIPLIDFRLRQSHNNLKCIESICNSLFYGRGISSIIVESANSYHAYGCALLDFQSYISYLGQALLFDPLVDGRHVAHQLIDGVGALRVK